MGCFPQPLRIDHGFLLLAGATFGDPLGHPGANFRESGELFVASQGMDNLRIVIVDDHNQVRAALTGFLSDLGSIVRACANADDAMALVPHFHPHLVLSDIAMPGKDGFALLQDIRSLDPSDGGKVPVIAITDIHKRAPGAANPS